MAYRKQLTRLKRALPQAHHARESAGRGHGAAIRSTCRSSAMATSSSNSPPQSPSSSARTAPANRRCSKPLARIAGYDEAGGGKGYMPVDHSRAIDRSGSRLGNVMRAHWLPKVTAGWFFRAESFYSVARYLDAGGARALEGRRRISCHGRTAKGSLGSSRSAASGRASTFSTNPKARCRRTRQIELLRLLKRWRSTAQIQVIMATHSPLLMACPEARLLQITRSDWWKRIFVIPIISG